MIFQNSNFTFLFLFFFSYEHFKANLEGGFISVILRREKTCRIFKHLFSLRVLRVTGFEKQDMFIWTIVKY